MKLDLNKEQYKQLLKFAYLGNWMINSLPVEEDNSAVELQQYLMKNATNFGIQNFVYFDESTGYYIPTELFEEEINAIIDEYNEECFWDTLETRLAERDMVVDFEPDYIKKMKSEQRIVEIQKRITAYTSEFETNGIQRLRIEKTLKDYK